MSTGGPDDRAFAALFAARARSVRRRLVLRGLIGGATVGLGVAVAAVVAAWLLRVDAERPFAALIALIGAGVGVLVAHRRRWSDVSVALYLDHRLAAEEAVTTAVDLGAAGPGGVALDIRPAHRAVVARATRALAPAPPRGTWPRVWQAWHGAMAAAAAVIAYVSVMPLPPLPPAPPPPPGSERVQLTELGALDEVIALAELDARDEAQARRLKELADRGEALRQRLRDGLEAREAQAEVGKLRDDVFAERMRFGGDERRRGLEAALSKMAESAALRDARRALGDRDASRLDEATEDLARKLEASARREAQEQLRDAARAAREQGAEDVARALEDQAQRLGEQGEQMDRLRALADTLGGQLGDEARAALEQFRQTGDPAALRELARALEQALGALSEEERQRLAERLAELARSLDGGAMAEGALSPEQLEALRQELATPEGQQRLAEQLRALANQPPSDEARRQQGLGAAELGLGQLGGQLGAPLPAPGAGGAPLAGGAGSPSRGGGPGEHAGRTDANEAGGVRARAEARINPAPLQPGVSMGRTPGRAGEIADKVGTGALGQVGPGEVGAVEQSEVPEAYRRQVGRYFSPR